MIRIKLIIILCFFFLASRGQNVNVGTGAVTPLSSQQMQQRSVDSVALGLVYSNDSVYNGCINTVYTCLDSIAGTFYTQQTISQLQHMVWAMEFKEGMIKPNGTIDSAQNYLLFKH